MNQQDFEQLLVEHRQMQEELDQQQEDIEHLRDRATYFVVIAFNKDTELHRLRERNEELELDNRELQMMLDSYRAKE